MLSKTSLTLGIPLHEAGYSSYDKNVLYHSVLVDADLEPSEEQ